MDEVKDVKEQAQKVRDLIAQVFDKTESISTMFVEIETVNGSLVRFGPTTYRGYSIVQVMPQDPGYDPMYKLTVHADMSVAVYLSWDRATILGMARKLGETLSALAESCEGAFLSFYDEELTRQLEEHDRDEANLRQSQTDAVYETCHQIGRLAAHFVGGE